MINKCWTTEQLFELAMVMHNQQASIYSPTKELTYTQDSNVVKCLEHDYEEYYDPDEYE